jgi:hypothetical protein
VIAIGRLLPIGLMILGGLAGALVGGGVAAAIWWGIGAGFVVGCAGMAFLLWGYERLVRR